MLAHETRTVSPGLIAHKRVSGLSRHRIARSLTITEKGTPLIRPRANLKLT